MREMEAPVHSIHLISRLLPASHISLSLPLPFIIKFCSHNHKFGAAGNSRERNGEKREAKKA